jgi:hypothetical protein
VFISEIFPNRHRAEGQALGSFTHWLFAALLTSFFPKIVTSFAPGYVFLFFCGMMVLQLVWVKTMVPETKGVPLERMQKQLVIELGINERRLNPLRIIVSCPFGPKASGRVPNGRRSSSRDTPRN